MLQVHQVLAPELLRLHASARPYDHARGSIAGTTRRGAPLGNRGAAAAPLAYTHVSVGICDARHWGTNREMGVVPTQWARPHPIQSAPFVYMYTDHAPSKGPAHTPTLSAPVFTHTQDQRTFERKRLRASTASPLAAAGPAAEVQGSHACWQRPASPTLQARCTTKPAASYKPAMHLRFNPNLNLNLKLLSQQHTKVAAPTIDEAHACIFAGKP